MSQKMLRRIDEQCSRPVAREAKTPFLVLPQQTYRMRWENYIEIPDISTINWNEAARFDRLNYSFCWKFLAATSFDRTFPATSTSRLGGCPSWTSLATEYRPWMWRADWVSMSILERGLSLNRLSSLSIGHFNGKRFTREPALRRNGPDTERRQALPAAPISTERAWKTHDGASSWKTQRCQELELFC